MTKTTTLMLWVNGAGEDRGQRARPCICTYRLAAPLRSVLYELLSAHDKHTGEEYPLEGDMGVLALNGNLDEAIAANDKAQVAFAKKEFGIDLKHPPKRKAMKKPQPKPKEPDDLPPLF
jgi:hypothetical protein